LSSAKPKIVVPPRERILQAARELFYRDGIRAVGVDAIAAAAGTNKMTLYRHFTSKDELVVAYLKELAGQGKVLWDEARARHPGDADAQLRYLLRRVSQFADECTGRGCALANAAVELPEKGHPARAVIEEFKKGHRERMVKLFRTAALRDPEGLADEVFLLIEGARMNIQSLGADGPASRLVRMIEALIDSRRP
jgi:AcrR family transcriptional regulator